MRWFEKTWGNVEAWWAKIPEKKKILIGSIAIAFALGVIGALFG